MNAGLPDARFGQRSWQPMNEERGCIVRVLITGGSGFIGRVVVADLLRNGHEVLGLARSRQAAEALEELGAQTVSGSIEDLGVLSWAAGQVDAVVHLAFRHDVALAGNFGHAVASDLAAIDALARGLPPAGALTIAGAALGLQAENGSPATETSRPNALGLKRQPPTDAILDLAHRGIRSSVVRLAPTVHGVGDAMFMPTMIRIAREKAFSGYPGDGTARWSAVHVEDAASLFRLAVEKAPPGSILHAVAEEGVRVRDIADAIGRRLGVPTRPVVDDEVENHFGFLGTLLATDGPVSSARTREITGWQPHRNGLLEELNRDHYFVHN